jgi:hypothetical protein
VADVGRIFVSNNLRSLPELSGQTGGPRNLVWLISSLAETKGLGVAGI